MSTVMYCDIPDCSNDDNDCGIVSLTKKEVVLLDIYDFKGFSSTSRDICEECLENVYLDVLEESDNTEKLELIKRIAKEYNIKFISS